MICAVHFRARVSLVGVLDPILKLTFSLRQLLDYDVAAADYTAVYDVRWKRDSLARSKFMLYP